MDHAHVARLVDHAERPREDDWTLRSALVRYAQVAPERAGVVAELVRRTDGVLGHLVGHPERVTDADEPVLAVAATLDEIGSLLAAWAVERGDPPHAEVESLARRAAVALSRMGVEPQRWDGPGRRTRT